MKLSVLITTIFLFGGALSLSLNCVPPDYASSCTFVDAASGIPSGHVRCTQIGTSSNFDCQITPVSDTVITCSWGSSVSCVPIIINNNGKRQNNNNNNLGGGGTINNNNNNGGGANNNNNNFGGGSINNNNNNLGAFGVNNNNNNFALVPWNGGWALKSVNNNNNNIGTIMPLWWWEWWIRNSNLGFVPVLGTAVNNNNNNLGIWGGGINNNNNNVGGGGVNNNNNNLGGGAVNNNNNNG